MSDGTQLKSRIRQDFPSTRLIVVGPGSPDKQSYRIVSERSLQPHVLFMGAVSDEMLPRYYRSADIFCAPATGNESLGIVLLEAMASSKPIVATRIEGFSSVLTHGQEGLLVPPRDSEALSDALALLIQDRDLREEMGARGRRTAERYGWETVIPQLVDYYQRVIATRR